MTQRLNSAHQFSVGRLFLITTLLAVFYGFLTWFGVFAHILTWALFLIAGPFVGIVIGIRRLREPDAIVNGVQAGACGGAAGFLAALLLLAPANATRSLDDLIITLLFGSQAAFAAGGLIGFVVGAIRAVYKLAASVFRANQKSCSAAIDRDTETEQ